MAYFIENQFIWNDNLVNLSEKSINLVICLDLPAFDLLLNLITWVWFIILSIIGFMN
jgi:hypothetical protein